MVRLTRTIVLVLLVGNAMTCGATAQQKSPFSTSWTTDGFLGGAGVGLGITALIVSSHVVVPGVADIAALKIEDIPSFDRGASHHFSTAVSTTSDWSDYALIAAPLLMLGDPDVREDCRTYALMYGETMLLTGSLTYLVKGMFPRYRPFTYNPEAPLGEKLSVDAKKSFYSSHTAFAFASAVFFSTTYGDYFPSSKWKPWVWAGSLTLATAVGVLRYSSGMHFPSDIATGAIVGGLIGYAVPALHRSTAALSVGAGPGGEGLTLHLALKL